MEDKIADRFVAISKYSIQITLRYTERGCDLGWAQSRVAKILGDEDVSAAQMHFPNVRHEYRRRVEIFGQCCRNEIGGSAAKVFDNCWGASNVAELTIDGTDVFDCDAPETALCRHPNGGMSTIARSARRQKCATEAHCVLLTGEVPYERTGGVVYHHVIRTELGSAAILENCADSAQLHGQENVLPILAFRKTLAMICYMVGRLEV